MSLHLAMLVFSDACAAQKALDRARARVGGRPWVHATTVIERHRDGRELVCGTCHTPSPGPEDPEPVAGGGGLMSAILGTSLGRSGRVAGLLIGAQAPDSLDPAAAPRELRGAYIEELRAALKPGASAILLLERPLVVDQMVATFAGEGARLLRRHLSIEASRTSVAEPERASP